MINLLPSFSELQIKCSHWICEKNMEELNFWIKVSDSEFLNVMDEAHVEVPDYHEKMFDAC